MSTFGVGFSEASDSFTAGSQAAAAALQQAGVAPSAACLCFLFCTSRHQPAEFFFGVKSITGDCRFFGGYANGTISNTHLGYDGYQTVVGILQSNSIEIDLFIQQGIAFNEYFTGKRLAQKIKQKQFNADTVFLLLFDAVNRQEGRFQMNYGTPFLRGFKEVMLAWPDIAGARLMGDMKFKPTCQWFEDQMTQNAAMALALTGNIKMDVLTLHGCTPASAYHTVTAASGSSILEIDYQPALDFVGSILGTELSHELQRMKFFVTMGKNLSDKWTLSNAEGYVNRMCVGIDAEHKGLIMAEMDLDVGTEFQLMRRGFEMQPIENKTREFIEKIKNENKAPLFAMYINCAGRGAEYSQNTEEDAWFVQKAVNNEFPLLGIYEGGELAKIGDELQVLDWTGIFCLFSEKKFYDE